ncbi:MAG: adenylate kinase [Ginsengibacter sp.]
MFNLILFGPPGSGKGTQSEKLVSKYNLKHVSTGDLLRSEIAKQSPLGIEAKILMDMGSLVPDHVVIGMIDDNLEEFKGSAGFLYDGFPRTAVQADALDKLLEKKNSCIDVMIAMEVSEEELVGRLVKRGETSGRSDDNNEQVIRARLVEYRNKTAAVADHYRKVNRAIVINGEGDIDEVFERLCVVIDDLKVKENC